MFGKKILKEAILKVLKYLSILIFHRKFNGSINKKFINNILYICLAERGDIVITSAAIRRTVNEYPSCQISYLSQEKYVEIAQCVPGISHFMGINFEEKNIFFQFIQYVKLIKQIRAYEFDLILDDSGVIHSFFLWIFSNAKYVVAADQHGFGVMATNSIKYSEDYNILDRRKYLTDFFCVDQFIFKPYLEKFIIEDRITSVSLFRGTKYVTFQPIAGWRGKCIDSRLANYIADYIFYNFNLQIVVLGGAGDCSKVFGSKFNTHVIDLTGKLNIAESMALVCNSILHVGADSFLRHVATAVDTPSITIYGSTNHLFSGYFDDRHRALFYDIPCRPQATQYCSMHAGRTCPHLSCISDFPLEKFSSLIDEFIF
jgi:ADP-heptose:LPS heptosyltransferase